MGFAPCCPSSLHTSGSDFLGLLLTGSSSIQSEAARDLAAQSLRLPFELTGLSLGLQYV